MTSVIFAMLTATGMYIVMAKIGIFKLFRIRETRKVADGGLDVLATFGLIAIFAGTVSGMMIAMMSGLMLSGLLFLTRSLIKPTLSLGGVYNGTVKRFGSIFRVLRKASKH